MKTVFKSLLLATALAGAGAGVFAQSGNAMDNHGDMMGKAHMYHMDPAKMEAQINRHLSELKAKLKLAASQESAWSTFAAAMKPDFAQMPARPDRAELEKMTTPERIDKMRALRAEHMTHMNTEMDRRDDAVKSFYAALNAEQKKIFDSEHARFGEHHPGERMLPKNTPAK
jgi:hypothetical protein